MMLCSSAYGFMKSPISSRLMLVFLKMGHISLNFSFKCSGTRISTSTHPNKRSCRTSLKISSGLIILMVSKFLLTSVAMSRFSSRLVLFIRRHSHFHISTTRQPFLRIYSVSALVSSSNSVIGLFRFSLTSFPRLRAQSWPCQ